MTTWVRNSRRKINEKGSLAIVHMVGNSAFSLPYLVRTNNHTIYRNVYLVLTLYLKIILKKTFPAIYTHLKKKTAFPL
jgi:hypothetical protein